jgi:glycosyltransferase involved in cell wall biosynthesis
MPAPPRICLSTQVYPPEIGGVGVAAQRLAETLVAAGYAVDVVAPLQVPPGGAVPEGASVEGASLEGGVRVHRVAYADDLQQLAFTLRALVRRLDAQQRFALFHGFFLTAVYPCVAAVQAGGDRRPIIASIRGNDALTLKDHPYTRAGILAGLRRASWVTSVSQAYLDRVAEEVDIASRSSVIRNGVKPVPEAASPWRLTAENRGVVGLVGKLRKVKDVPLLVRGYAAVPPAMRRRLLLAGAFDDREEEAWTATLISEFGLTGEVALTGDFVQPRVFDHLRAMHVYVQSSAAEGLPNALLEAASLGVPLVATAVGGMREVITDGESGLLVPHGDPGALGAAITRVLASDALAAHLSEGARRLAASLSPEREQREWLALYRGLLDGSIAS